MSQEFVHIRNGVGTLRMAFERARITVASIDLAAPDDGLRLLSIADRDHSLYDPWLRDDGSPGFQATIHGILIRWPGRRVAQWNGGWRDTL